MTRLDGYDVGFVLAAIALGRMVRGLLILIAVAVVIASSKDGRGRFGLTASSFGRREGTKDVDPCP